MQNKVQCTVVPLCKRVLVNNIVVLKCTGNEKSYSECCSLAHDIKPWKVPVKFASQFESSGKCLLHMLSIWQSRVCFWSPEDEEEAGGEIFWFLCLTWSWVHGLIHHYLFCYNVWGRDSCSDIGNYCIRSFVAIIPNHAQSWHKLLLLFFPFKLFFIYVAFLSFAYLFVYAKD